MDISALLFASMDVTLHTDGSALAGIEDPGYGGIVTTGDPEDLNVIDEFHGVGRKFTLSYLKEKAALHFASLRLASHDDEPSPVTLIC